jgi:hypothetical protein
MAIEANHITVSYFTDYIFCTQALLDHIGNIVFLFTSNMVESKYYRITLTAVDARPTGEIIRYNLFCSFFSSLTGQLISFLHVLGIVCIAFSAIFLLASDTHGLQISSLCIPDIEL